MLPAKNTKMPARASGAAGIPVLAADNRYCVTDFTASPVLKSVPETGTQTAEASSTSVAFTTPILVLSRRITAPVAGSLISLVTRST